MGGISDFERLATLPDEARERVLVGLNGAAAQALAHDWEWLARPEQLAPAGDWRIWLMMAGRGFGKTRAGAEWVRHIAEGDGTARIALVGATLGEAQRDGGGAFRPAGGCAMVEPARLLARVAAADLAQWGYGDPFWCGGGGLAARAAVQPWLGR
jgi:hypothetical protein